MCLLYIIILYQVYPVLVRVAMTTWNLFYLEIARRRGRSVDLRTPILTLQRLLMTVRRALVNKIFNLCMWAHRAAHSR